MKMADLLIEFDNEIEKREAELKDLKSSTESLKTEMLKHMEKTGTSKISMRKRTLYLHRQMWASVATNPEKALAALKNAHLDYLVKEGYNLSSVSAYFRELPQDDQENPIIPEALKSDWTAKPKFDVRVLKLK